MHFLRIERGNNPSCEDLKVLCCVQGALSPPRPTVTNYSLCFIFAFCTFPSLCLSIHTNFSQFNLTAGIYQMSP